MKNWNYAKINKNAIQNAVINVLIDIYKDKQSRQTPWEFDRNIQKSVSLEDIPQETKNWLIDIILKSIYAEIKKLPTFADSTDDI